MFVGVCRLTLLLPGNGSLKGKRRVIKSIIERTRARFNAGVAEVADNDALGRGVIGIVVVGNAAGHVDSMLSKISAFVERSGVAPVARIETELIPLGDEIGLMDGPPSGGDEW